MSPEARRSFSEADMKKSSCAMSIGTTSCATRKVASISLRRPCQSGTLLLVMIRSARSNATPARALVLRMQLRHHLVGDVHEEHERRRRRQHQQEVEPEEESQHSGSAAPF